MEYCINAEMKNKWKGILTMLIQNEFPNFIFQHPVFFPTMFLILFYSQVALKSCYKS